jgi:hypothetical protein
MKLDYSGTREQGPVGFLSDTVVWQVAYFGAERARHHTTLVTCDAITTPTQLKSTLRFLTLADPYFCYFFTASEFASVDVLQQKIYINSVQIYFNLPRFLYLFLTPFLKHII